MKVFFHNVVKNMRLTLFKRFYVLILTVIWNRHVIKNAFDTQSWHEIEYTSSIELCVSKCSDIYQIIVANGGIPNLHCFLCFPINFVCF